MSVQEMYDRLEEMEVFGFGEVPTPDLVAWLWSADHVFAPVGEESRCSVVSMQVVSGVRPALLWPSENDPSMYKGWIMDAPEGTPFSFESLREMRYTVSGKTGSWVAIKYDEADAMLLARFEGAVFGAAASAVERAGGWCMQGAQAQPIDVTVAIERSSDASMVRKFQNYVLERELECSEPIDEDLEIFDFTPAQFDFGCGAPSDAVTDVVSGTSATSEQTSEPTELSRTKGKRSYPCNECDRVFSQSGHRNEHVRKVHRGVGHQCNLCNRIFGVPSKLERHVRAVHNDQRNHSCTICDKKFKERSHMRQHMRTHGGAKLSTMSSTTTNF